MSLNNLASRLGEVGRRDEALAVAQEAVTIRRQLAEANPAAYLPDLAMSLNNLASRLGEVGRRDEALAVAQEAVTIRRQLAEANPAAYLRDLAMSLNNLASRLGEVGRRDEALAAATEAANQYRQLAEANPAAYLRDLAMSLNNLASRLGEVGRSDEALAAATEAANQYRQLAEANPAAYLRDLAMSLNNLASRLGEVGRSDEALAAATEAANQYRQLAEANPAAYLPDLATSLNNLAIRLGEVGRSDEALAAATEAANQYRQLAEANPAAYLPDLATSLNNLASRLGEVGRSDEALAVAQEAVTIRRQLAEANPAAYLPDLAMSLNNLAYLLTNVGRADEAEALVDDVLKYFARSPLGRGHILLARGRWRASQNRVGDAILDLTGAMSALDDVGDRITLGRVRRLLRRLREDNHVSFDKAWSQARVPLPVWLQYPATDTDLARNVLAWIGTPDWPASKAYLDEHRATLLTDNAEAVLDHLIDDNPTAATLQDHLDLLRSARAQNPDAAYTALQERLLTEHLIQTLQEWVSTRNWADSQAYAMAHSRELLNPTAIEILGNLGDQAPGDQMLRLHRGLLFYAAVAGFDDAYELRANADRRRSTLATLDPDSPVENRLALARLHSGQSADDPEAHFQLALTTLLAGNTREAAAALTDCADNAAPFERRDFARRLGQLASEDSELTPLTAELEQILVTKQHTDPDQ